MNYMITVRVQLPPKTWLLIPYSQEKVKELDKILTKELGKYHKKIN